MQTLDIRFLKNLKEKLNNSNLRSIYLNALPKRYLTRLDLADLDTLQEGTSKAFIECLLNKANFNFPISPANDVDTKEEAAIIKRLSSITIEHNDHYEEHGTKTFGFGYPILLVKDPKNPKKIVKAPLIIWSLNISRNLNNENEWIISREENFSVTTNTVLASFLRKHAKIQLQPMYDQMLEDSILDKDELAEMAHLHMKQLNPNISDRTQSLFRKVLDEDVAPIKSKDAIESLPLDSPIILWSGVFGLFRSQKDSIVKDLDYFIDNINQLQPLVEQNPNPSDPDKSSFMKHSFTMLETDPSQQEILHHLDKGKNLVVQGPPGTGKSQTLTGIIANTISNAGTCLVVCEKKTALDVIYSMLEKMGLQELAVIVEDVYRDRAPLVQSVRERAQHQHKAYQVSPNFIRLLKSCASHVNRLQSFHKKLQQPLLGDNTWTEVVGSFLEYNQQFDKNILNKKLRPSQFDFSSNEFEAILAILSEGEMLFKELGTMNHPLNAIHDRFFRQANAVQVEDETKKALDAVCKAVQSAQRDAFTYLFEYEQLLEQHFAKVYTDKMNLTDKIIDLIEGGLAQSSYHFNKNAGFYRKLMKRMSDKVKKLEEDKVSTLEHFLQLQKYHAKFNYFNFTFLDTSNHTTLEFKKLLENINEYKMHLYDWHEGRMPLLQELVRELGPGKIYKHVSFDKRVREITKNLNVFEQAFAKKQVFKVNFKFATRNIRKRLTQIEDLDKNLQKLQNEFDQFSAYHALKFFWLNLNPKQQAAFLALADINPKNWIGTFSSWYTYHLLAHHENKDIPDSHGFDLTRTTFEKELQQLQKILVGHTLKYWRGEQTRATQIFNQQKAPLTLQSLYNTRGSNAGHRTALRKIIESDPNLFTRFFPVVMVSPAVCASILPLHPGLFDVVIFDEASQLNLEDTFGALVRGKYKIISGDSHQLPPPDSFQPHYASTNQQDLVVDDEYWDTNDLISENINYLSSSASLLDYALSEGNYMEAFLEVHYRSRHPYLIDFSNAAFYGKRLMAFPTKEPYTPITFKAINGVYQNYCNEAEADAIIDYLLTLDIANQCPSIAIATFNLHQRNLILEKIQQKAQENPTQANQLQQLLNAGLFVKNLENIQGEERDILLLSTTFGLRENGSMPQTFGPINHEDGYKLLNVIITRAKEKVCIFNSIPSNYYQNYQREILQKGNTGKGIFYAYLAYAEAVSEGHEQKRQEILNLVFDQCQKKPFHQSFNKPNNRLFEQQVFSFLQTAFPNLTIKSNYQHAGFSLPIAILNDNNQVNIAFYHDIFHERHSEEAYAWDMFHEMYLKKLGIHCYRIWSKDWWENTHQAQQKLIVQIRDIVG